MIERFVHLSKLRVGADCQSQAIKTKSYLRAIKAKPLNQNHQLNIKNHDR